MQETIKRGKQLLQSVQNAVERSNLEKRRNSRNRSIFPNCNLFYRQNEFNRYSVNHFVQIQTDKTKEYVEIILQSYESQMRTN